jgi:hypothetical protein
MNLFQEAFNKVGLTSNDFQDREVNDTEIKANEQIEFFETWLKMLQRNASDKEKHNFLIKHGFLSINQFELWLSVTDDYRNLEMQLNDDGKFMSSEEYTNMFKEIELRKSMAEDIKRPSYYLFVMRQLDKKDISPYGEDILKSIRSSILDHERVWTENNFKNCKGLLHF